MKLREHWDKISTDFCNANDDVVPGKMMSADALTLQGKVFAFYSTKGGRVGLGCKIGRDFNIEALGLTDWQHLAPFKSKPPMKDWIVIGETNQVRWSQLLEITYQLAQIRRNSND